VEVENQEGESIQFTESSPGNYTAAIGEGFFQAGNAYRLRLVTTEGKSYESDFTQVFGSTAIDSVYYMLESQPTSDPEESLTGLRFYMDLQIDPGRAEFMRWELIETFEFRNPDYPGYIYDVDRVVKPIPDSMSDRQCWITGFVNAIFTLDAGNLERGKLTQMPLHFVSNETQRLRYRYSLMVRQYSLDEPAFRYWDELKKNSRDMDGIFSRQPTLTPGNVCNCEDPGEKVLGFFSVSGISEKRIFVEEVPGLTVPDRLFCFPAFEPPRFRFFMLADLPIFLSEAVYPYDGRTYFGETQLHCLDCRLHPGSSGDPPPYWNTD